MGKTVMELFLVSAEKTDDHEDENELDITLNGYNPGLCFLGHFRAV
jgi:hypothetical protein